MKRIKLLIPAVVAIFMMSCNSTQVLSSYKNENVPAKSYNKILVLGIFQQKDRNIKAETEQQLAEKLKSLGYNAKTAMEEYGPKAFDKLTEDQISDKAKTAGFDAVITTALLDKKKDQVYQQGTLRYQPVGVYYNRFGRYYATIYDRVYDPGYYTTSTDYFLESNLYDVASGDLLYSVQTKAFDPGSASRLANDNSKRIIKDLNDNGLLVKK